MLYLLLRALRLGNFGGPIVQYGPLNWKLFSAVKMSSEDSFEMYLKGFYTDREKQRKTLQDEENLPNFHVDFVELFEGTEQELEQDKPDSSQELLTT